MKGITVVIPSFFYGHIAAQAIESVLGQTRPPEKILFVDDGAKDCAHLPEIYPQVEYLLREENIGIVHNFQEMLMKVGTEKTMFLGADNWLRPDTLEVLDKVDADIVSYDIAIVGDGRKGFVERVKSTEVVDGYNIWRFHKKDISKDNYIHGSSLYNTEKAQAVGYKPSGGTRTEEDWMLWRGMLANGATHVHVPEPMLYYRRHILNFNGNQ